MPLPTFAPDWWTAKTTLAAIAATIGLAILCVVEKRGPLKEEVAAVGAAWIAAFMRDAGAKAATGTLPGQPGDATPVTTTKRVPQP